MSLTLSIKVHIYWKIEGGEENLITFIFLKPLLLLFPPRGVKKNILKPKLDLGHVDFQTDKHT